MDIKKALNIDVNNVKIKNIQNSTEKMVEKHFKSPSIKKISKLLQNLIEEKSKRFAYTLNLEKYDKKKQFNS